MVSDTLTERLGRRGVYTPGATHPGEIVSESVKCEGEMVVRIAHWICFTLQISKSEFQRYLHLQFHQILRYDEFRVSLSETLACVGWTYTKE